MKIFKIFTEEVPQSSAPSTSKQQTIVNSEAKNTTKIVEEF